ncbi:MAG: molecular chaperone GrpE [Limisphaerales bacterium]
MALYTDGFATRTEIFVADKNDQPGQNDASDLENDETSSDAKDQVEPDLGAEGDVDDKNERGQAPDVDPADEIAQLKDQVLRSLAEVENIKRRTARDVENAHKFAIERLLNDLFPVVDSLEKAVETAIATDGAEAIAEGVQLSLKLFVDTLGKSGVEQIDPLGVPFDPQEHEALTMIPNPDAEPNSVMDVMAKGYKLNGRLVRAAKVIVVQGS